MDEILKDFLTETAEHIQGVESQLVLFERDPTDAALVSSIFRLVHTIKGTSSFLGLNRMQRVAHSAENLIGELREGALPTPTTVSLILAAIDRIKGLLDEIELKGSEPEGDDRDLTEPLDAQAVSVRQPHSPLTTNMPPLSAEVLPAQILPGDSARGPKASSPSKGPETIRVAVDTIERIMQLVSELVLTRNQLLELTRHREDDMVKSPLQRLSSLTTDLQDAVMRARMQPVSRLFSNLPRLVRELSGELGKKIDLVTEGDDTELDRQLIEVLRDPLTHLIRNSADHGIELPEARLAAGKTEFGEIRVAASHEAGQITIAISDDGKGLDIERIKQKVLSQNLATEAELARLTEDEICRFIFEPEFSTASVVTNVSGRGVGMDVVRSNIELIGGSVSVSSKPGRGCVFLLKIPLTLAIAPALIILVAGQRFALPQHAVVEAVAIGSGSDVVEKVQNSLVLKLRDEVIPVVDLQSVLKLNAAAQSDQPDRLAVIMRVAGGAFGIIVDAVIDIQEIVVKPLSASLAHLKAFCGHTILGDGSVVLILDPAGIGGGLGIEKQADRKRESAKEAASHAATRLLLFKAGPGALKALPVSLVGRIEMIEPGKVHETQGGWVTVHQKRLMPLTPMHHDIRPGEKAFPALVITERDRSVVLLVEQIVDIVEEELTIQLRNGGGAIVGTAEIRGEPVEFVDISHYLNSDFYADRGQVDDRSRRVMLVGVDGFAGDMLLPLLRAARYDVSIVKSWPDAEQLIAQGGPFNAVLFDMDSSPVDAKSKFLQLGGVDAPLIGLAGSGGRKANAFDGALIVNKFETQAVLNALTAIVESDAPSKVRAFAPEMAA